MTADSTEGYATIDEIYQKFSPIFQYENIDKLTIDDFKSFFTPAVRKFFGSGDKSLEYKYAGIITTDKDFPFLKIAIGILVDESKPLN